MHRRRDLETGGHHSHNLPALALQRHPAADYVRVAAELLQPERVAENYNVILARLVLWMSLTDFGASA